MLPCRWCLPQVVRLTDQLAQILDEADYMKEREVHPHDTTAAVTSPTAAVVFKPPGLQEHALSAAPT